MTIQTRILLLAFTTAALLAMAPYARPKTLTKARYNSY